MGSVLKGGDDDVVMGPDAAAAMPPRAAGEIDNDTGAPQPITDHLVKLADEIACVAHPKSSANCTTEF